MQPTPKREDSIKWFLNTTTFSIQSAWEAIRPKGQYQSWTSIVCSSSSESMAVKTSKAEKKIAYDQKLCQLLDQYTQVLIAAADNVGSNQLQNIRQGLRGDSIVLMGKNTMMKRSIRIHSEKTGNKAYLNLIPLRLPCLQNLG
ncbi:unnamed protein product [Ilex paraguariensis]|uniref:Ribosomal protein L10 n=1 Tax=Ilex paraguariensis TaxID=185542 RepID=A0ABC8RND1_9AQUA